MFNTKVVCPNGHANQQGQKFCSQCGTSLENLCPKGHRSEGSPNFCSECGSSMPNRPDAQTPAKRSWMPEFKQAEDDSTASGQDNNNMDTKKMFVIIAAAVVAAGVLGLLINAAESKRISSNRFTTTQSSSDTSVRQGSSLLNDWLPAVCKPGTFFNGDILPNASAGGSCQTNDGNLIIFGQYGSEYMARNDRALYTSGSYTLGAAYDGRTAMFIAPTSMTALEPLAKFGFQIQTAQ